MLWWKGFVLYFSTNKPELYFIQNNEQKKTVPVSNQLIDKASGFIQATVAAANRWWL